MNEITLTITFLFVYVNKNVIFEFNIINLINRYFILIPSLVYSLKLLPPTNYRTIIYIHFTYYFYFKLYFLN